MPASGALAITAANVQPRGQLSWAGVNAVQIIQAVQVKDERAGTGTATPFQSFTLANNPVLTVSYSYGGGPQGQAAIGAVNSSVALPGGFSVTNPVPTWGASQGESVSDGEAVISRWLRHRDRLVTADDFRPGGTIVCPRSVVLCAAEQASARVGGIE